MTLILALEQEKYSYIIRYISRNLCKPSTINQNTV